MWETVSLTSSLASQSQVYDEFSAMLFPLVDKPKPSANVYFFGFVYLLDRNICERMKEVAFTTKWLNGAILKT